MNQSLRRLATVVSLSLAAAGCSRPDAIATNSSAFSSDQNQTDLSSLTYRAVDLILAAAPEVSRKTPLVVASLADTQNLEKSSALGNIVADMIRTRLAQTGHETSEVRMRAAMSMKQDDGEFLLSRNRSTLMRPPSTAAVVTGTYAISYDRVYVSIKLISATDAHIVSGADFVLPLHDVLGLVSEHHT
jgi:TolB-like protein